MNSTVSTFVHRPQVLWLRRALFQVHLWSGLVCGLYILLVSVSGSAIIFRHEMDRALCPRIIMVKPSGPRMSDAQLQAAAAGAVPVPLRYAKANTAVQIRGPRAPGAAVEVWYLYKKGLRRGRMERLFDPYRGTDLGSAVACEPKVVLRLVDLHADLLGGHIGQTVNGIGGGMLVLMCMTGVVIWWPGLRRWRRSLTLRRRVPWRRFVWDLHSFMAFWVFALIFIWALSGIYLALPDLFPSFENFLAARGVQAHTLDSIDILINGLVTLHFGRGFGLWIEVLWAVLGLVPAAMIVTGALMWWNRVLRKVMGRSGRVLPGSDQPSAVRPAALGG